jgi:IS30 family transposase
MFSRDVRVEFWGLIDQGWSIRKACVLVGVSRETGRRWFGKHGGVNPNKSVLSDRWLSVDERDEICDGIAAGRSVRSIAAQLGRAPSTISREIIRNSDSQGRYLVGGAQRLFEQRLKRPKASKLATNPRLSQEVASRLANHESPAQISGRLKLDFPDDVGMRVSHETIYRELYIQARGGLKREFVKYLRRKHPTRKPRRSLGQRPGVIQNMINIKDRPVEVSERVVPGHWEGDLIIGAANQSAIGTLVERVSNLTLLVPLPEGHDAERVAQAIINVFSQLPTHLRRTLTWDQGSEMANHLTIKASTGIDIYFCDPHSPWQRASNENTNGLLRQYFPKSTDLSIHTPEHIAAVQAQLNDRPRKRLGYLTPEEVFQQLLLNPTEQPLLQRPLESARIK